jgi:hypothetical protein
MLEDRARPLRGLDYRKPLGLMPSLFLCMTLAAFGAQYEGQKVDGRRYWGFARSLDTGKYYLASMVFEQNHATVDLESGKRLDLTLDDETIEDPEEVVATDPRGLWWALSLDGLGERPSGSKTLILAGAAAPQDSR